MTCASPLSWRPKAVASAPTSSASLYMSVSTISGTAAPAGVMAGGGAGGGGGGARGGGRGGGGGCGALCRAQRGQGRDRIVLLGRGPGRLRARRARGRLRRRVDAPRARTARVGGIGALGHPARGGPRGAAAGGAEPGGAGVQRRVRGRRRHGRGGDRRALGGRPSRR